MDANDFGEAVGGEICGEKRKTRIGWKIMFVGPGGDGYNFGDRECVVLMSCEYGGVDDESLDGLVCSGWCSELCWAWERWRVVSRAGYVTEAVVNAVLCGSEIIKMN